MSDDWQWRRMRLKEIAELGFGATPSRNAAHFWGNPENGFPWVSISDLRTSPVTQTAEWITKAGVRNSSVRLVAVGTPLMSFKLTIGRVAVAGTDLYTNEAIVSVSGKTGLASDRWLLHALPGIASTGVLDSAVKGNTLNKHKLEQLELRLPPLAEQRRIAEVLDTADGAIRATGRLIAKLEQSKQGLLQDLLARGVDHSGLLRDPEHQPDLFIQTPLGLLPKAWKITNIGAVADVFNGSTPSRLRCDYWDNGKIPWISSGKVNEYQINSPSELITDRAVEECSLRLLPPGAIVVGMIGEGKTRGMTARLNISTTINQNLAGIVPRKAVDGKFLHLFLSCNYETLRRGGRGSNQDALNAQLVSNFQVAVPDIQEQRTIERIFTALEDQVSDERQELEKLRCLKRGLTDDLLTGRVRVGALM